MLAMAIPNGLTALGAGTVLALAAAAFVLGPLLREDGVVAPPEPRDDRARRPEADTTSAVDALREIEFDRATGKLSDDDYGALKATYTQAALAELRAKDAAGAAAGAAVAVDDDEVERTIQAFRRANGAGRVCTTCGPRPESDAVFCSTCGRYLAGACPHCGAACTHDGQRFCGECGHGLSAAA